MTLSTLKAEVSHLRSALGGQLASRPEAVLRYGEFAPYDTEVLEAALTALGPRVHPAKALLKGRLAAAR